MTLQQNPAAEAWKKYIQGKIPVPKSIEGVPQIIVDSWRRSQRYGVDPSQKKNYFLPEEKLKQVLIDNSLLMDVAYPYLMNLYQFIKGTNYQILLTDKRGCILKCIFGIEKEDEGILSLFQESEVSEGIVSTEATNGTNGVSLCLATKMPVEVRGPEHYYEKYHTFVCSGVPLHDPEGSIIGCVSMMGPQELHQSHTLGMLCAAASGIERELKVTRINYILESTLNSFTNGVIILDSSLNILHHNSLAASILGMKYEDLVERNIFEILDSASIPQLLHGFRTEVESLECSLTACSGTVADISLTIKHSAINVDELNTTMLIFTTQKSLHRLTNQIAGFSANYTLDSIIGDTPRMQEVRSFCRSVASSPSTVLIQGESGTGKELIAQAIHNSGNRASGPFVSVNCGAIPKDLIESELFGYESGAFTGAKKNGNPGKFELANGGTLFLDEIGDMPLELQKTLLRVLTTHQVTRLGGKTPKNIDVKIIAATNVDLQQAVEEKTFRRDLYYRLNVLNLEVPPLRERKEDIIQLLYYFAGRYCSAAGSEMVTFDEGCLEFLMNYDWPGNVRELENIVERAVIFSTDNLVTLQDLPSHVLKHAHSLRTETAAPESAAPSAAEISADFSSDVPPRSPEWMEYQQITAALQRERGHVKTAASELGIPLSSFYRKLEKYHINPKEYKKW